jgi:hypothetical protein
MKAKVQKQKRFIFIKILSRLSIFFNLLGYEKTITNFFFNFYDNNENLINNFKLKNYRLISEKTLFLLRNIFKSFLNSFGKNIKINKIIT